MLQAQIDIIDQAGHIEESATILGSGRVSVGTRQTRGYLHADEAQPDFAVITQNGQRVSLDVKAANAIQLGEVFVDPETMTSRPLQRQPRTRSSHSSKSWGYTSR